MIALILIVAGVTALLICCAGLVLSVLRLLYYVVGLRVLACLVIVLWFAYHAAPPDPKTTTVTHDPGPRPYACSLCVVPK